MIGERFGEEKFGSKVWECIEEGKWEGVSFIIKEFLKEGIGGWEERIRLENMRVSRVDGKIEIEVRYVVNGRNCSE